MGMITNDVIDDIADRLYAQYQFITNTYSVDARERYFVQLRDDTILVANVVHKHNRFYDMESFFRRAGYVGTAPAYSR